MESVVFKTISVKNFKNIKEASLNLDHLNIIVGANNSGKTNFLKIKNTIRALFKGGREGQTTVSQDLFIGNSDKVANFEFYVSYEVGVGDRKIDAQYHLIIKPPTFEAESQKSRLVSFDWNIERESLEFKEQGTPGPARQFFRREGGKISFGPQVEKSFPKDLNPNNQVSVVELITSLTSSKDVDIKTILDGLLDFCDATIFSSHETNTNSAPRIRSILEVLNDEKQKDSIKYDKFINCFQEALCLSDFEIHRFTFPAGANDENELKAMYFAFVEFETSGNRENLQSLSDGSKLLFCMLYEIIFSPHNLILIDEPEIGLHPRALSSLFNFLRKESIKKRVILSTHSSYLLNIVDPRLVTVSEVRDDGKAVFTSVLDMPDLQTRLKSKYVKFGDLLVEGFRSKNLEISLD